jgi:hypothetical protein
MTRLSTYFAASAAIAASFVAIAGGQDVNVAELSAKLSSESADLQKAQNELQTKREALKKEAAEVQLEKDKIEKLKAAAKAAPDSAESREFEDAQRTYSDRQEAYNRNLEEYVKAKEEYNQRLQTYNRLVDELNSALPKAIQDAGAPFPTEDEFAAPPGDFQVEDLEILSSELKGTTVGDGSPTSFVQEVAKLPRPAEWEKGDKVVSATIRPGTPIATFNADGVFGGGAGSHAAIFVTQNSNGIWVYDQYKSTAGKQRPVDVRFIRNRSGKGTASNDASTYFVVKRPAGPELRPPEQ